MKPWYRGINMIQNRKNATIPTVGSTNAVCQPDVQQSAYPFQKKRYHSQLNGIFENTFSLHEVPPVYGFGFVYAGGRGFMNDETAVQGNKQDSKQKKRCQLVTVSIVFCKNAIFVNIPNLLYSNRILPVHRFRFLFRLFLYPRCHWLPSSLFLFRLHPDWLPLYQP